MFPALQCYVLLALLAYLQHLWSEPLATESSIAVQQEALEVGRERKGGW